MLEGGGVALRDGGWGEGKEGGKRWVSVSDDLMLDGEATKHQEDDNVI